MPKVIALLCSDLHIGTCPVARSAELDWFLAMRRGIDELKALQLEYGGVPIVVAGDVFDRWGTNPEIINWAIDHLPQMFSIPGQHDLPNHQLSAMDRSAYATLVRAGVLIDLKPNLPVQCGSVVMVGFPWGTEVVPYTGVKEKGCVYLAVVHHYLYVNANDAYVGISADSSLGAFRSKLKGFDAAVFGDNHKSWVRSQ